MTISNPVNDTQRRFNEVCARGGGQGGGPARTRVQRLLHQSGEQLMALLHQDISSNLGAFMANSPSEPTYRSWGDVFLIERPLYLPPKIIEQLACRRELVRASFVMLRPVPMIVDNTPASSSALGDRMRVVEPHPWPTSCFRP